MECENHKAKHTFIKNEKEHKIKFRKKQTVRKPNFENARREPQDKTIPELGSPEPKYMFEKMGS